MSVKAKGMPSKRMEVRLPRPLHSDAALLAVFGLWSLVPLALLFVSLRGGPSLDLHQGVFNGSDGIQVSDHFQYFAWIREAGDHVLSSNRFDVVHDPRLFLHPMFALSGLAWKLGASIQLSYLAWKPLAVLVLFGGFAAYARRLFPGDRGAAAVALLLALFFLTPATVLVDWLGLGDAQLNFSTQVVGLEMFAGPYVWGGYPGAVAVGMMPVFLLGIERVLDPSRRREGRSTAWYALWTGAAGLLASWLHPWQGLTLLVITAGLVAWGRFHRRYLALALPVALTAAPIAYFFALSHTASAWHTVAQHNTLPHFGLWLLLGLAPPLLLALPGLPGRDLDVQERLVRIWPAAALVVYFSLQQSWFYHAFAGLSLPLAMLTVRGWRGLPKPVAVLALVALLLPGVVWAVQRFRETSRSHFMAYDEVKALKYVEHSRRPGAVMAPFVLGQAVPAFADRNTWVGHYQWTPDYDNRVALADALFDGRFGPRAARRIVLDSRVAFLVSDCRGRVDLRPLLGSLIRSTRHFGCATVYELRPARNLQRTSVHSTRKPSFPVSFLPSSERRAL